MKIVLLDAKSLGEGLDFSNFHSLGEFVVFDHTELDELVTRIKDCEVIITNKVHLQKVHLKHAENLKLICMTGTGTNHFDSVYAKEAGIKICNVKSYCTDSVAQHTFAMVLFLLEHLGEYQRYTSSGAYIEDTQFTHYKMRFHELAHKKWGIIGYGEIGKAVARLAKAFGCDTQYYSTSGANLNGDSHYVDQYSDCHHVELDELLLTSDVVSIHAPLNEKTLNLLDERRLRLMKPEAILVNVGRGGIINEKDLVKVVKAGLLGGVGLDVIEKEPMAETSPLLEILDESRVLITPHVAWASIEARQRVVTEVYYNIKDFYKGEPRNIVETK